MENSSLLVKSQKQPNVEVYIQDGNICHLGIDGDGEQDFIDNPAYILEIYKVLHHACNLGVFKKQDEEAEIYDGNLTPTIFI